MDLVKQKYHWKCTENIMENMDTDITIETRYYRTFVLILLRAIV